ncbi:sporulation protein SPS19 [Kalaharituber pfeilii]|nr:sporulation protein SPS19 [Kalaharituber pfeilii]
MTTAKWKADEVLSKIWAKDIFKGKVVFCTGGAGTICSAQVAALVLLGANAAILGRSLEKTTAVAQHISSLRPGSIVLPFAADVRSITSLTSAVETTLQKLGQIDFVIAGAAGNFLAPVTALSANAFKTVVDIDLIGSYNTVKAKIIFVSATMHYTGIPFQAHVAAAKAAVDALSATLSIELGPLGVTSNVIAPGPIRGTEGMSRLMSPGVVDSTLNSIIPLQRQGDVKDIADATVWLLSEAGDWVTGAVVTVDGGSWRTQPGSMPGYPGIMRADWDELIGRKGKQKGEEKAKL